MRFSFITCIQLVSEEGRDKQWMIEVSSSVSWPRIYAAQIQDQPKRQSMTDSAALKEGATHTEGTPAPEIGPHGIRRDYNQVAGCNRLGKTACHHNKQRWETETVHGPAAHQ